MELNLFFDKLASGLNLGEVLHNAIRVYGGLMHKMYKLDTTSGDYIIKLLNKEIMKRPIAMNNFIESERLEIILEKNDIKVIPALFFNNKKMQIQDEQYFYVYKWYDGKVLQDTEITKLNCFKIGKALSQIHNIDMQKEKSVQNTVDINLDRHISIAKEQNSIIYNLLIENRDLLLKNQENNNLAIQNIPAILSICHNDMDTKNILWLNEEFKIIDLECLSYSNPYIELFDLALCWSGFNSTNINFELFRTFIQSYFENGPEININWQAIYNCTSNRLEWLEYNIKRALFIECSDQDEQKLGIQQVKQTLNQIIYYHRIEDDILNILDELKSE